MPRSFLIANKRYSSSTLQNHKTSLNNFDAHDFDVSKSFETKLSISNDNNNNNKKLVNLNEDSDDGGGGGNGGKFFDNQSNREIQQFKNESTIKNDYDFDNNESKHSFNRQDSLLKPDLMKDDLSNIKVIINFTPPSTPFQNVPANEIHTCTDCGKSYSTSSNLTRHRQTHRSVTDKKARKCPHCDKIYVSMPAYSMHVRTHTQGCQCHFCGKCFSRPWLLQGHIRTHTGEKPFKCHICSKAFADKSNLRAHVQTHSLTKPFICSRCGKAFALKSYLYKHEESSCMRTQRETVRFKRNHYKEPIQSLMNTNQNRISNNSS